MLTGRKFQGEDYLYLPVPIVLHPTPLLKRKDAAGCSCKRMLRSLHTKERWLSNALLFGSHPWSLTSPSCHENQSASAPGLYAAAAPFLHSVHAAHTGRTRASHGCTYHHNTYRMMDSNR